MLFNAFIVYFYVQALQLLLQSSNPFVQHLIEAIILMHLLPQHQSQYHQTNRHLALISHQSQLGYFLQLNHKTKSRTPNFLLAKTSQ